MTSSASAAPPLRDVPSPKLQRRLLTRPQVREAENWNVPFARGSQVSSSWSYSAVPVKAATGRWGTVRSATYTLTARGPPLAGTAPPWTR